MASVFSKIIQGELPGYFVWDDELCVAIMTIQPVRPGHVLVIPREEINHWDDMPDDLAAHLMVIARKITKAIKNAYPSQRVGLMVAGFEVPHTHLHLIPADSMHDFDITRLEFAKPDDLAEAAEKIRQAL